MSRNFRMLTIIAVVAAAFGFSAATGQASADNGVGCLWAGGAHAPGDTVVAGGWNFTCDNDRGSARWFRGHGAAQHSTVPNPGAGQIVGMFSPGAQQPGTDYNDYCVGSQLIEGSEAVYEVVTDGRTLWWKASASISRWTFGPSDYQPGQSWRSSSMCYDSSLS